MRQWLAMQKLQIFYTIKHLYEKNFWILKTMSHITGSHSYENETIIFDGKSYKFMFAFWNW